MWHGQGSQYSFLRTTIKRVIQDYLLNGTVQRFRGYIDAKRLSKQANA